MSNHTESQPPESLSALVSAIAEKLLTRELTLGTAESCTGGMIASACTDLPGSSAWFERGVVCYSNQSKTDFLGVSPALIQAHGAVSEPVAMAMALGVVKKLKSDVGIAVTGIAGPDGGSPEKPVGTVFIAWCIGAAEPQSRQYRFYGDRKRIRKQSVFQSLTHIYRLMSEDFYTNVK